MRSRILPALLLAASDASPRRPPEPSRVRSRVLPALLLAASDASPRRPAEPSRMRSRVLPALLLAASAAATSACASRTQPYRFSMPMLGQADVPGEMLGRPAAARRSEDADRAPSNREPGIRTASAAGIRTRYAYGWQRDAQSGIRTVSAAGIELRQPEASADSARAVIGDGVARVIAAHGLAAASLRAPHRAARAHAAGALSTGAHAAASHGAGMAAVGTHAAASHGAGTAAVGTHAAASHGAGTAAVGTRVDAAAGGVSVGTPSEPGHVPSIREPSDLRALVGTRDKREPFAIVMGWLADLGVSFTDAGATMELATPGVSRPTDGPALVAWASLRSRLLAPTDAPSPGDVLVFHRAVSKSEADLVAVVIGRDERGVTEFMYSGGGVIRRGFVDPLRPSVRRDLTGAVINTFLRHGRQWPPKGTRYLAGELLAHVIRTR